MKYRDVLWFGISITIVSAWGMEENGLRWHSLMAVRQRVKPHETVLNEAVGWPTAEELNRRMEMQRHGDTLYGIAERVRMKQNSMSMLAKHIHDLTGTGYDIQCISNAIQRARQHAFSTAVSSDVAIRPSEEQCRACIENIEAVCTELRCLDARCDSEISNMREIIERKRPVRQCIQCIVL